MNNTYVLKSFFSKSNLVYKFVYFGQIARTSCNRWFKTLDTIFFEYLALINLVLITAICSYFQFFFYFVSLVSQLLGLGYSSL